VRIQIVCNTNQQLFNKPGAERGFVLLVLAVSADGIRVSWKDNFESHYTEVVELGR